ncbi:hypothetical protein Bbelb_262970 [Branchiostoma belcheri]|nr:hypothetical protein Bbelb_262970 [Branchiostoma belcheri]
MGVSYFVLVESITRSSTRKSATLPSFCRQRLVLLYLASILLSDSYAPEPNPGPEEAVHGAPVGSQSHSSWMCGTCDRTVGWDDRGLACDTCGQWFHAHCQSMDTELYQHHEDLGDNVSWHCAICGNPNSKTVFDLYGVEQESQSGMTHSDASINSCSTPTELQMKRPLHSSTPTRINQQDKQMKRPLRLVNLNLQSSPGKKADILNMIDSVRPDIIIATETWLDATVYDSEILPDTYRAYRRDRNKNNGGVIVRTTLNSSDVPELHVDGCEVIWVRVKLQGRKSLYVCAYYRPDVSDRVSLEGFNISVSKV